jgi:hypothetical protein
MKHAGPEALAALSDLLSALRSRGLKERSRGAFYRGGRAWLHFHEDKAGLFADIRLDGDWRRLRVSEPREVEDLLAVVDRSL